MKNKLESLKSTKFEAFKGMEVNNPLLVIGGQRIGTTYSTSFGQNGTDTEFWNCEQVGITGVNNTHVDPNGTRHDSDVVNYAMAPIPDPNSPKEEIWDIERVGPEMP